MKQTEFHIQNLQKNFQKKTLSTQKRPKYQRKQKQNKILQPRMEKQRQRTR